MAISNKTTLFYHNTPISQLIFFGDDGVLYVRRRDMFKLKSNLGGLSNRTMENTKRVDVRINDNSKV